MDIYSDNYIYEELNDIVYNISNTISKLHNVICYYKNNNIQNPDVDIKNIENKIIVLENTLNQICEHKWEDDYIDLPYGEGSEKITYCNICNINKDIT
jgi:hypothetical protein